MTWNVPYEDSYLPSSGLGEAEPGGSGHVEFVSLVEKDHEHHCTAHERALDPQFFQGLTGAPNKHTPFLIAAFMNFKCFEQGCIGGYADVVNVAWRDFFELLWVDLFL
jgi:hypothetical protein